MIHSKEWEAGIRPLQTTSQYLFWLKPQVWCCQLDPVRSDNTERAWCFNFWLRLWIRILCKESKQKCSRPQIASPLQYNRKLLGWNCPDWRPSIRLPNYSTSRALAWFQQQCMRLWMQEFEQIFRIAMIVRAQELTSNKGHLSCDSWGGWSHLRAGAGQRGLHGGLWSSGRAQCVYSGNLASPVLYNLKCWVFFVFRDFNVMTKF